MNASDFNPKTWIDFFEIDFQSNDDGALEKLEAMISAEFSEKSIAVINWILDWMTPTCMGR